MRGILPGPQPGGSGVESVNGKAGIVNLTTADIDDSNNRRYVTESEKTKLNNTSGTNSGDQNSSTVLLSEALPVPLASETTVHGALSSIAPLLDHPVDSVNGLTGAVILTTDNIGEATNKKYVTDAEKILLGNTSGSNTGDQNSSEVSLSATLPTPLNTATTVQEALVAAAPLLEHPVDSVNGKTGSVTLSTVDINDTTDKRYVTDSQLGIIQNTSGTNTGDQSSSGVSLSTELPAPLNTATNVQDALEQIVPLLDPPVDSVNGQTGAVVLTTADVADSNDKRYVTEAEKTKLSNLSGTNTGDQNSSTVLLSAALPAPLSSETTVQGALASIAPLLGAIEGVPAGAIIIWTGTACPAGWSRETALDGLFLKGAAAAAAPNLTPAGSNTHAHDMSHNHGLGSHTHSLPSHTHNIAHTHSGTTGGQISNPISTALAYGDLNSVRSSHTHDFTTSSQSTNDTGSWSGTSGAATGNTSTHSGDTATASNEPQHVTVLFCKKD